MKTASIRRSDTKNCSQKGFLAQLWHQKICRTQLWQKSMWEKLRKKKPHKNKYMYNC